MADLSNIPTDQLLKMLQEHPDIAGATQPEQQPSAPPPRTTADFSQFKNVRGPVTTRNINIGTAPETPEQTKAMPQQQADILGGFATGTVAGLPGLPGNIESYGRQVASQAYPSVSPDNWMPTSKQFGNMIAGPPSSPQAAGGRDAGEIASGFAYNALGSKVIGPLLKAWAGLRSGVGQTPIQEAFNAGAAGGQRAADVSQNMAGTVSKGDAVDMAKSALSKLYEARGQEYRNALASGVISDPKTLDFAPIRSAIDKAADVGTFKGVSTSESASKVRAAVKDVVDRWESLPPDEFHTAEGLDALKKQLNELQYEGSLRADTVPHSKGAKIIDGVRNAVKDEIVTNFPAYKTMMGKYSEASDEISNIERALSLGDKASVDTSLSKLQSLMRDDVTNRFGLRNEMGNKLNEINPRLLPSLAGQSLSSPYPRGLNKALASGELGAAGLAAATSNPMAAAALATDVISSSPRVVGNVALGAGRMSPYASATAKLSAGSSALSGSRRSDKKSVPTAGTHTIARD